MKHKLLISTHTTATLSFFRRTILSVASLLIMGAIITSCDRNFVTDNGFNIVAKGDSIYFPNFKKGTKLYKMNYDGSNISKVSNAVGISLTADNEYVFYQNLMNQCLYKVNDSGTTKISDLKISGVSVSNGTVYATTYEGIYSLTTDGQNLKLLSDKRPSFACVYNEMIYFSSLGDLFSMDLDGLNVKKVIDDIVGAFIILENNIYLQKFDDDKMIYLYTADLDGLMLTKTISTRLAGAFDVTKDGIFFISEDSVKQSALFHANLDGSDPTKIAAMSGMYIKVVGTYLYSYHPTSGGYLDMLDLKTNKVMRLL